MARFTGKNLYMSFGGTAINPDFRTLTVNFGANTTDSTAGDDEYASVLATTKTVSVDLELLLETGATGDGIRNLLKEGATGEFLWGEEGNTGGSPKSGFNGVVTNASRGIPYADVVTLNVTIENTGSDMTFDARDSDTW